METPMPEVGFCDDAEVISTYTRAQALADGELVDLSELAREAGIKFPLAVTQGVWGLLMQGSRWIDKPDGMQEAESDPAWRGSGQSWRGRAWDMLQVMRYAIRASRGGDRIEFSPLFLRQPSGRPERVQMWAQCGPGDTPEPVITVMLRGED